ncbi:MAG: tyrosine--tRNA ligase [Rickettsiales bacterium]|nr:tyrosine--tRNA ligase [Rickettsiales bacterium]
MKNFNSKYLKLIEKRGFIQDCTDFENLDKYLYENEKSGSPAIAYIGFDCTAKSLHAGSLMQIMALRFFQKCGHKPIILLGGGTTLIGDPSGKDSARQMLTQEQIEENKNGIKKVFTKYVEFEDVFNPNTNKAFLVDNAEWLNSLQFIMFLRDVGKYFSINRMLTFDSVKTRLEREQDLSFLEFNYMIMQAYDFVELNKKYACRVQIGGSDQWGNIVNGIELERKIKNSQLKDSGIDLSKIAKKDKGNLFGLTTPLLTNSEGAKMGKTADGAVWLDSELLKPYDFWQYWRNISDADLMKFAKLFLDAEENEIENDEENSILKDFANLEGAEINKAKIRLATEITKLCHGENEALLAEETAHKVFAEGVLSDNLPIFEIEKEKLSEGISAFELLKISGLCESGGEARRLIKGGGARINDEKISDENLKIDLSFLKDEALKLSSGKKKHIIVRLTSNP